MKTNLRLFTQNSGKLRLIKLNIILVFRRFFLSNLDMSRKIVHTNLRRRRQ